MPPSSPASPSTPPAPTECTEEVRSAWRVWHYMTCAADVKREHMVYCVNFRFADGSERYVFMTPQGEPVQ